MAVAVVRGITMAQGGAGYMAMEVLTARGNAIMTSATSFPGVGRLSTAELPVALQPILVVTEVMEVEVRVALAIKHLLAAHTAAAAAAAATAAAAAAWA